MPIKILSILASLFVVAFALSCIDDPSDLSFNDDANNLANTSDNSIKENNAIDNNSTNNNPNSNSSSNNSTTNNTTANNQGTQNNQNDNNSEFCDSYVCEADFCGAIPTEECGVINCGPCELDLVPSRLATGFDFSCFITGESFEYDGDVYCWGDNSYYQLGELPSGPATPKVIHISTIVGAVEIVAGGHHACARQRNGAIKCWGRNDEGQLGLGFLSESETSSINETATEMGNIIQLTAGENHTCALRSTGDVHCWGANSTGQTGQGDNGIPATTASGDKFVIDTPPTSPIQGLQNVVQITAGDNHTCALEQSGTIKCWGYIGLGTLGNGEVSTNGFSLVPIVVEYSRNNPASFIAAGSYHTCAISGTELYCWGENQFGELGHSSTDPATSLPVSNGEGGSLLNVHNVDGGYQHTCGIANQSEIRCWGSNHYGQHGNAAINQPSGSLNPNDEYSTPYATELDVTELEGLEGSTFFEISAGNHHNCVLAQTNNGEERVFCWGGNTSGQVDNGLAIDTYHRTPVEVIFP